MSLVLLSGAALSRPLPPGDSDATQPTAPPAARQPQAPTIAQALASGVLIVISKASQRMQVFRDGQPWLWSPVSTGRRGHTTPAGVFPILDKQRFHRSNLYSNAPMPFMQRLTGGGIALHAGVVPAHPASHGCIRMPYAVARTLFGLTRVGESLVVIVNAAMHSDDQARRLALAVPQPAPATPDAPPPSSLAYGAAQLPDDAGPAAPAAPAANAQRMAGNAQTIQLAAALSRQEADARWAWLIGAHAELARFNKTVVPVLIGPHRYFRLRASGPGAHATCSRLKGWGIDCFNVI